MSKRLPIILFLTLCILVPSIAAVFPRYYLPGYSPLIYNQVDVYKLNNGLNFNKPKPYLIQSFGTVSTKVLDIDSSKVEISTMIGEESVYPDIVMSFNRYIEGIKAQVFHKTLISQALVIPDQTATQTGGLIKDITIDLPNIAIPKSIRRILGNKAGRLNLDGTQKISLSGTSTKRKIIPIYELNRGSRFELKMQQDTNLRLTGTIGEKIAVNLKYNSNQDEAIFDPNNINIKYTGDEDEVVQSVEAGNIALVLSGSRYISYSTSSQGLFGITSKLKVGSLDLTVIASKEEGQKNTQTYIGQSQADSTLIYGKNYAPRTFYYLEKPDSIYAIYSSTDTGIPEGWKNNAIKTSNDGAWFIKDTNLLPKKGTTVRVFIDDGDASNNIASAPGDTVYASQSITYVPYYDELIEGTDVITNYELGTIQILKNIDRLYTVAVQYTRNDDSIVPSNSNLHDGILHVKVLRSRNQEYDPSNTKSTWDYQMRNIYSMGISNIKKDDFELVVFTEGTNRERITAVPDSLYPAGTGLKYSKINNYLKLDANNDDKVNGDDVATINLSDGYIIIPMLRPFEGLLDSLYTQENESIDYNESKHFISVKGKIGRDILSLGQTGILKGSVKVKVNGTIQKESSDYIVDYDMGQITFLTSEGKSPDSKIEIDYEYRSGFAVAQKSLAGFRADWNISENSKLGGTVIYRTESVEEKRPKIGSENMKLFLADIDGSTAWKPGFITNWIDALPLVKTNTESRIALSGEAALTIPNISGDSKHKNDAYIDDMEGILDAYPLGLSLSSWVLGSKPWQTNLAKGRTIWYEPDDILMKDVFDLSNSSENEKIQKANVLALKITPNSLQQPGLERRSYGGIMKYVGNQLDFSKKKYLELLVKVDTPNASDNPNVTLHVDLGDINEDFNTEFGKYGALNVLNTEDTNHDGDWSDLEDTGIDGILSEDGTVPGDDPNDYVDKLNKETFCGTEKNGKLDTEDLDNNGVLNQLDRYLSYSVYVPKNPSGSYTTIGEDKYILYRITLNDPSVFEVFNNSTSGIQPTLKKISYVRIWAECDKAARILIGSASIVGNKWEDFLIRDLNGNVIDTQILNTNNELYISGITDKQKNPHYTSPKNTTYKEGDTTSLEQALTLTPTNLQAGHQVFLRQRLFDYYDLRTYQKLKFWVFPEKKDIKVPINTPDSLDIIFRLGADSLNYYQVRQPVKVQDFDTYMVEGNWKEIEFGLQDLSVIKDSLTINEEHESDSKYYSYRGVPTLTNIKEFTLGVQNRAENISSYSGIVYFNDIRVSDPFEDLGWAGRLTLNSTFADLSTLDIDYEQKSLNFNPTIQRGRTQNTGFATLNSIRIAHKLNINKFFPDSWGLRIPLSLDRNFARTIPRYRAYSDVLRSKIVDPVEKKRERTENLSYSASIGISQASTSKSKIIAYTLNKMSVSAKASQTNNNTATTSDSTFAWQGVYNYNVNLPENFLAVSMLKNYKIKLLPGGYTNSFTINSSIPKSYNWEKRDSVESWFPRYQSYSTKTINTDNGITWALTRDINTNYRLMTKRDLMQKSYFKSYNIGKETEYNQEIGANYSPQYFPNVFSLTNSVASRYTENQRKYTETNTDGQVDIYQKDGNSSRTIRLNLTFQNSSLLSSLAASLRNSADNNNSKQDKNEKENKKEDELLKKDDLNKKNEEKIYDEDTNKLTEEEKLLLDELDKNKKMKEEGNLSEEELERRNEEENLLLEKLEKMKNEGKLTNEEMDKKKIEEERLNEEKRLLADDNKADEEVYKANSKAESDTISNNNKAKTNYSISPAKFIELMSKVKNVTATYQNGFTQSFLRQNRRPNFAFQLGLPNQVSADFIDSKSIEDTYTLASGVTFSRRIDSTINYSYAITQRFASASNQTVAVTFPDITLTVSEINDMLGLSKFMEDTRLNSNYQFTLRQNGDINWAKPKQETKTYGFNPLISLTTNLAKSVQTTLSYTTSNSINNTDMIDYMIVRKTDSQGVNANFSYSFKSSTGIELPFTKKKINIKNELTSSMSIQYEKNFDTIKGRPEVPLQVDRNTSRISVSPSATYQFDQNIRGGLTSGYELNTDKKRDDYTRIFRMGLWIEITL